MHSNTGKDYDFQILSLWIWFWLMKNIGKYSFGVGDRFAHQAKAQLSAFIKAEEMGIDIAPVWNKSHREHTTIGSTPKSTYDAALEAVKECGWSKPFHLDADHINLKNVEGFLEYCDFYTIDVADYIGAPAESASIDSFIEKHSELVGTIEVKGIESPLEISKDQLREIASKYLLATQEAASVYKHLVDKKGADQIIPEVSMDETDAPQTPPELLVILAAIADNGIPVQTIAPKFTGRFNKGVDYVGDLSQFSREFEDDLCVISHAIQAYGLPSNLKLSVHSGSDKFSIYQPIKEAIKKHDAGLHIKTAGTTWLEELIGLAEAGGQGLELAKDVYKKAFEKKEELCAPYASVIDVDDSQLPSPAEVVNWASSDYVNALRHDQSCDAFNPHFRQLLHVGYKVAAQLGDDYLSMLKTCEESISRNVAENIFERHMKPLFL